MTSNKITIDSVPGVREQPRWMTWTGRVLTALATASMLISAGLKLSGQAQMHAVLTTKLGYPEGAIAVIGVIELVSAVLYAVPRTTVIGALLLSAYLGGAVASHVRIGESFLNPLVIGLLVWAGLLLRRAAVRALVIPSSHPA
jgi:hypothetical protein